MKRDEQNQTEGLKPLPEAQCYTAGDLVLTHTASGDAILCTVIEPDRIVAGEWLLASPAHGYAIQRSADEIERYNDRTERPPNEKA